VKPRSEPLDRGWEALEEGELELALELADELAPDLREGWVLRATALLELGLTDAAREAIARAEALGDGRDVSDLGWVHAELDLCEWRIEEALEGFERVAAAERTPAVLGRLALCWDVLGDLRRADALLQEAQDLDPEGWPAPVRVSAAEFERAVDAAVERLPEPFRRALSGTRVLLEPMPSAELIDPGAPAETPPDLLGLFVGASALERSEEDSLALPPTIHLFQRNLERASRDHGELLAEIQTTLYHELGHLLGFDEHGVAEMGLE